MELIKIIKTEEIDKKKLSNVDKRRLKKSISDKKNNCFTQVNKDHV